MIISLIVAVSENNVIGKDNDLVWKLPADMAFFKSKTRGHHILTGRKNYESIPEKFRPLPDRVNIVLTRQHLSSSDQVKYVHSIEEGIEIALQDSENELFIIGGGEVYKQSLSHANRIYLTKVHGTYEGDTYFPELNMEEWQLVSSERHEKDNKHDVAFTFLEYRKK